MKSSGLLILCATIVMTARAHAQTADKDTVDGRRTERMMHMSEERTRTPDTVAQRSDTGFTMKKSPLGAVLRSVVIPGWGQFYNQSYWKIPIVWGLSAFLIQGYIKENKKFTTYRDLYGSSITACAPDGNLVYKQYREFYRDLRDTYAFWFIVTYFVQIADAFVDAHLYDFDVGDEVKATVSLNPAGRVQFSLRF